MRVLYIGGTGEISTACIEASLEAGHDISVFNRGTSNNFSGEVTQYRGDLQSHDPFLPLKDLWFDAVCQFIAFTPDQIEADIAFFQNRCDQYVFISSASVYQKPPPQPVTTESTPLENQYWPYAASKIASEKKLTDLCADAKCDYTIVRPSHTYRTRLPGAVIDGDHQTWRMLNNLPIIVHGDGSSLWTLTHATDFAKAFVALLGNEKATGEAVHITNDTTYSWNQIIETVAEVLRVEPQIIYCDVDLMIETNAEFRGPLLGDKANSMTFDNRKLEAITGQRANSIELKPGLQLAWQFAERKQTGYQPDPRQESLINRLISRLT